MLRTYPHARALIGALVLALLAATMSPAAAIVREEGAPSPADAASDAYIVQLVEAPVVGYEGDIAGLAATATDGKKLNVKDAKVQRYVAHLAKRHQDVGAAAGVSSSFYDYFYSFNGFAATLTAKQANELRKRADVASVEKDELGQIDTATTPAFLGLTDPGTGLWAKAGGVTSAGEDIIVGVVDTGIWPEHPSFSDQVDLSDPEGNSGKRTLAYGPAPAGWNGSCQSGEQFSQNDCNNKIIGARYYLSGFGHFGIIKSDFKSPRDADGHGTHTASTAAGNHAVPATGPAAAFGSISGMAPRARIAAYKVCWNGGAGGCANTDSVAAIDQAVADGVDVINFSISGTSTNYLSAVEVAYLFAARAGVFVSTSAGNSGPTAGTVAHISPWLASVAAGTHNRSATATVTLGNGATYTGASITDAVGPAPLVSSTTVGITGADATQVRLCYPGTLDPALATGKIVQCDRGTIARTDKSAAVKQAGGVGMILTNTNVNSLNADFHFVPTVHLAVTDRAPILAYITAAGSAATAALSKAVISTTAPAPAVAAFSSRGPSRAGGGDILKPDFMAPGVDILAGVSPVANGRLFDLLSGTSMSSPHVAGIGALLKQAHPDWSPAAIRSALATTASTTVSSGTNSPFAIGSGQIKPNLATDPGLVYDAGFNDYRGFLRGQGLCRFCFGTSPAIATDASDLNQPTIAFGDLAGKQTVTRRVRNVGSTAATYTATTTISGVTVVVTPASLTLAPGETKLFTAAFTRTIATLNAYAFGTLTWSDGTHSVKSRLAVRPVAIAAPASITGTGASGSATDSVKFGYDGPFTATPRGLVAATKTLGSVADDPTNNFNTAAPDSNQGITVHPFAVPAGTKYARFATFDTDVDGAHDLDMYVYRVNPDSTLTLVGFSAGGTAEEQVSIVNPLAATYRVYIHGWQTAGGGIANYTLSSWQVPGTATSLSVTAPSIATTGGTGTIIASWTGLTPATRYLGLVTYHDATTELGRTVVSVTVP